MITELGALGAGRQLEADLCIVGAGAAGVTIACELAGSGLKVCLVESGGLTAADSDPALSDPALSDGDTVGWDVSLRKGRAFAFGGTTTLWTGRCAPLDPEDFDDRPWGLGWPITRAGLEPYYDRALAYCGFKHAWLADEEALATAPGLALPRIEDPRLAYFVWRYAMHDGRSFMNWGREHERELAAARDVEVLLHATLTDFEVSESRRQVESIVVRSLDGAEARIKARAFALCCGGVANAALLLEGARATGAPFGGRGGHVGRFFQQHARGAAGTLEADQAQSDRLQRMFNIFEARKGVRHEVGWALSADVKRTEGLLGASAILIYHPDPASGWESAKDVLKALRDGRFTPDIIGKLKSAAFDAEHVAQNAIRRARTGPPILRTSRIDLLVDLEQAPDSESRITLSERRNGFGKPLPKVDWRISELERTTARRFAALLKAELERQGLGRVELASWLAPETPLREAPLTETYHHIGGTRMSAEPSSGVVDADCRVHDMDNLYVAGCSVFPTGGHANPTFTIVALALRLADHLRATLKA